MRSYVLMSKYFAFYSATKSYKHFSDYRQCIISETYLFSKKWKSIFKHSVKVFRNSHLFEGLFLSVFFIVSNEGRVKWYNIFVMTTSSTLILQIDEYFWMTAAHNKVFLKISHYSQENGGLHSNTGVLLWILGSFQE